MSLEIARTTVGIFVTQCKYAFEVLDNYDYLGCKPVQLPMDSKLKLTIVDLDVLKDHSQYWRLISRLLYLTITRPNLSYSVNSLDQFMHRPFKSHLDVVFQVLQYVKGTLEQGLYFSASSFTQIRGFSKFDWVTCVDSRRSIIGYCLFLGDSLVSWGSN